MEMHSGVACSSPLRVKSHRISSIFCGVLRELCTNRKQSDVNQKTPYPMPQGLSAVVDLHVHLWRAQDHEVSAVLMTAPLQEIGGEEYAQA